MLKAKNIHEIGKKTIDGHTYPAGRLEDVSTKRWQELAERTNMETYKRITGKEPQNYEEVRAWMFSIIEESEKAAAATATLNAQSIN